MIWDRKLLLFWYYFTNPQREFLWRIFAVVWRQRFLLFFNCLRQSDWLLHGKRNWRTSTYSNIFWHKTIIDYNPFHSWLSKMNNRSREGWCLLHAHMAALQNTMGAPPFHSHTSNHNFESQMCFLYFFARVVSWLNLRWWQLCSEKILHAILDHFIILFPFP